jgi:hypothetical protein
LKDIHVQIELKRSFIELKESKPGNGCKMKAKLNRYRFKNTDLDDNFTTYEKGTGKSAIRT